MGIVSRSTYALVFMGFPKNPRCEVLEDPAEPTGVKLRFRLCFRGCYAVVMYGLHGDVITERGCMRILEGFRVQERAL